MNLSTHSARAQLRPTPTSSTKTADFTCSIVNASQEKIKMSLGNTVTANISNGKYYYDLELVNTGNGSVTRLMKVWQELHQRLQDNGYQINYYSTNNIN